MKQEHYQEFREFLERSCGIVLGDNKQYLVASRLAPIMLQQNFADLGELVARLGPYGSSSLRAQVIEAMTTNETQFFRDVYPYAILKDHILPELQKRRAWQARIWSAGCSSGQEAYSISMTLQEYNEQGGRLDGEVVGTDISPQMVEQAARGRYTNAAVARGLTPERRDRFFTRLDEHAWEVRPEIRRRASFRPHNLLESFAVLGRFDIIFCRNVLIYFSAQSRADILSRMARSLNPGGYLVVGASESLARQADDFEMVRLPAGVIYQAKVKA